jgi:hypothetical protein
MVRSPIKRQAVNRNGDESLTDLMSAPRISLGGDSARNLYNFSDRVRLKSLEHHFTLSKYVHSDFR